MGTQEERDGRGEGGKGGFTQRGGEGAKGGRLEILKAKEFLTKMDDLKKGVLGLGTQIQLEGIADRRGGEGSFAREKKEKTNEKSWEGPPVLLRRGRRSGRNFRKKHAHEQSRRNGEERGEAISMKKRRGGSEESLSC